MRPVNKLLAAIMVGALFTAIIMCCSFSGVIAYAQNGSYEPAGKFYEFDKGSHYEIDSGTPLPTKTVPLGTFSVNGNAKSISVKNGVESYEIKDGSMKFTYKPGSLYTGDTATDWHIIDDKSKVINGYTLSENILKASIIVQSSLTGEDSDWITDVEKTNVVGNNEFDPNIYFSREIQQINGCYYRVIVAYELRKQIEDTKVLFASFDTYEYKKCAEVYRFYLINSDENASDSISPEAKPFKELGKVKKVVKDKGYYDEEAWDDKDPHFNYCHRGRRG